MHSAFRGFTLAAVATVLVTLTAPSTLPAGAMAANVESIPLPAVATVQAVRLSQPGMLPFPVEPTPRCDVLDNFGDPRSGGRRHEGTDILATLGQPVYAVANGRLNQKTVGGSLSGNAWRLTLPDGTYYYYAHLSDFAPGLEQGDDVTTGQLIGYVGDTGNPGPGNYHLHFEVHPQGGAAVNPLPLLQIPSQCRIY